MTRSRSRYRNVQGLSTQRLACAILLEALVPAAAEPGLATLAILTAALSVPIIYESVQFAELRDRLRHQLSSEPT